MGNVNVKQSKIKRNEMIELAKMTMFRSDIIFAFNTFYRKFSSLLKDDGVIDYKEFLLCINLSDSSFTLHLFNAFDQNCNKKINFREFIKFFSIFHNSNTSLQLKVIFKLFCDPQSKLIEKKATRDILIDSVKEIEALSTYLSKDDIENIVDKTFNQSVKENEKDEGEYEEGFNMNNMTNEIKVSKMICNDWGSKCINTYDDKLSGFENLIEKEKDINDNNNYINYDKFSEIFYLNPSIAKWVNINVDKLKSFSKGCERKSSCF